MKKRKWVLISIGSLIGLVVTLATVGYFFISRPSSTKSEMRQVEASTKAVQSFDQKIRSFRREVKQAAETGEKEEIRLKLTEEELTSKLSEFIKERASREELPVEEVEGVQVNVKKDKLLFAGKAKISGIKIQGGAEATLKAESDQIKLEVEKISLGQLPLPGNVKDRLISSIPKKIELEKLLGFKKSSVDLKNVRLNNGELIIEVLTK